MRFADLVVKFSSEGVDKVNNDVNSLEKSLNDVSNAAKKSASAVTKNFNKFNNIAAASANMQNFGNTTNASLNSATTSSNNYKSSLLDLIQTISLAGLQSKKSAQSLGYLFARGQEKNVFKSLELFQKKSDEVNKDVIKFREQYMRLQGRSGGNLLKKFDEMNSLRRYQDAIKKSDDLTDKLMDGVKSYNERVKKGADGMNYFDDQAKTALETLGAFGAVSKGILLVAAAIAAATAAVYNMNFELIKSTVQAAFNFEELSGRLKALKGEAKSADILSFVRKLAEPSNFTTDQLGQSAVQLEAFGLNAKRILPTIAQLGMAFGADAEKLRLLTDMFGRLSQGQLPDAQVMAQFGLSKSKLMKEGIKFDAQGSLLSSTREVFVAIEKIVNTEYNKIFTEMAKTGNARLASVTDVFDRLKIQIGDSLMEASKRALGHLTNLLTAIERTGIMEKVAQSMLVPFQALADVFTGKDKSIGNLQATMANFAGGFLAIFEEINIQTGLFVSQLARAVQLAVAFQGGNLPKVLELVPDMLKGARGQFAPNRMLQKGSDYSMAILGRLKEGGPGTDINELIKESKKTDFGKLEDLLKPATDKDKKDKEKNQRTLELIQQNTKTANEITLRNLTYGGGQLAAQGISAVQMSGNRTVSSPQISASNDIVRGIEKIVRGYSNSNNLNFSFRRS
jgi:hypothetical protein